MAPDKTVTRSSAGWTWAAMRKPLGTLSRIVTMPGLRGSPSRTAAWVPGGSDGGPELHLRSAAVSWIDAGRDSGVIAPAAGPFEDAAAEPVDEPGRDAGSSASAIQ